MTQSLFSSAALQSIARPAAPNWQQVGGGPSCVLYQPNVPFPDQNGTMSGWFRMLASSSQYAAAFGLPWDKDLSDGTVSPEPSAANTFGWLVDNGSYALVGFPGLPSTANLDGTSQVFVSSPNFDPRKPLTNIGAFYGTSSDGFIQAGQNFGTGLLLAAKGASELLGAAASAVTVLTLVAQMGGPIGALAATISSTITTAIGLGTTGAATVGIGAGAGGSAAALAAMQSAMAAAGTVAIPASIAVAAVIGILMSLYSAFPADSPSMHPTFLYPESPIAVWYLQNGNLTTSTVNGTVFQDSPDLSFGVTADVNDVDAETFFAGLVYLRAVLTSYGSFEEQLNLVWTSRVSSAGIAAFRKMRAANRSISDAINATLSYAVQTPLELYSASLLAKSGMPGTVPTLGSAQALACLRDAHTTNEANLSAYVASPAFASSPAAGLARTLSIAAGVPVFTVSPSILHAMTLTPASKPVVAPAVARSAPLATAPSSTTHPLVIVGSALALGTVGFLAAPRDVRAPVTMAAGVMGALLSRFIP